MFKIIRQQDQDAEKYLGIFQNLIWEIHQVGQFKNMSSDKDLYHCVKQRDVELRNSSIGMFLVMSDNRTLT